MNAEETEATRLYDLLKEGKTSEFLKKIEEGFDIDGFYFSEVGTFLYKAVYSNDVNVVEFLLENGANPNTIYNGNNAFYFLGFQTKKHIESLRKLIDSGIWILPFFTSKKTIIDSLEDNEAMTEEVLERLDEDIRVEEEYLEWANYNSDSNRRNRNRYGYGYYNRGGGSQRKKVTSGGSLQQMQDDYVRLQTQLDVIREQITILRPIAEKHVRKLKIAFSGSDREEELQYDNRANVRVFEIHIYNFFMDNTQPANFQLIMPSFHLKNKRVMDSERALSDYGVRDGTKLVVTPILQSQRHGGATRRSKKSHRKTKKRN